MSIFPYVVFSIFHVVNISVVIVGDTSVRKAVVLIVGS